MINVWYYAIVDTKEKGYKMIKAYDISDKSGALNDLYLLRKKRYKEEHPGCSEWEYDKLLIDNFYNLIKFKIEA